MTGHASTLDYFLTWERELSSHPFLVQAIEGKEPETLTWAEAGQQARKLASFLVSQGWPPGRSIAILGKNSAFWVLSDLAISMAGHVSVPIYPSDSSKSIQYILENSEACACFAGIGSASAELAKTIASLPAVVQWPGSTMNLGADWTHVIGTQRALEHAVPTQDTHPGTIIYTSGTTGAPKGVVHSHRNLLLSIESASRRVRYARGDRFFSYLPLAHIAERIFVEQAALRHGGTIHFNASLQTFDTDLFNAQPHHFFSVPRLWEKFQQAALQKASMDIARKLRHGQSLDPSEKSEVLSSIGLGHCRSASGGGAPMPKPLLHWYSAVGLPITEGYGMTENCANSHATAPHEIRHGAVGRPHYGVEQKIDPQTGEIMVKTPAVMLGYFRAPDLTAEVLTPDGWLKTGDKGTIDSDGYLTVTGRLKDSFKTSKGKYVNPSAIEAVLLPNPHLQYLIVTGANQPQPIAVGLLSESARPMLSSHESREQLMSDLSAHLAAANSRLEPHEQVSCMALTVGPWTVENGLLTPTLKVRRKTLELAHQMDIPRWSAGADDVFLVDAATLFEPDSQR